MHPMLNIAVRAARRSGNLIVRFLEQRQNLRIETKGANDFVSEVDKQSEATIIDTLHKAYPEHTILGEESGLHHPGNGYEWVIDPLDGTTNFLHGHPQFSVSIALRYQGRLEQAVVYDPLRQELFTASRGKGAFLNDRRIRVSGLGGLKGALIGTGFPIRTPHHLEVYLNSFRALFPFVAGIRRTGSAALDLAYVACGRLDGFWELDLQEWDMAAGVLLIEEGGGLVTDFNGGQDFFRNGHIMSGSPKVLKAMLHTIQPHLTAEHLKNSS
ncbi:MAG: inositol monophosphatase family protein [Pseudomonadota bacterium]|nr:inositol monophosphatase family protein [Pseudomonadota bacterium]